MERWERGGDADVLFFSAFQQIGGETIMQGSIGKKSKGGREEGSKGGSRTLLDVSGALSRMTDESARGIRS